MTYSPHFLTTNLTIKVAQVGSFLLWIVLLSILNQSGKQSRQIDQEPADSKRSAEVYTFSIESETPLLHQEIPCGWVAQGRYFLPSDLLQEIAQSLWTIESLPWQETHDGQDYRISFWLRLHERGLVRSPSQQINEVNQNTITNTLQIKFQFKLQSTNIKQDLYAKPKEMTAW